MGIFDFLGDLSSKRSKELGLGGLQSLLGTRGAAQAGAIGDEMIGITNKDSLPGYFNEQTREYVPWYVDLFDGGGLNKAGTVAEQEAAQSMTANARPGGAPMAQPGLLRPRARQNPLEPFGGAGPTIPEGPLGPFGGAGPAMQNTPDTSYYTPPSSMQMPTQQASAPQQGVLPQEYSPVPMQNSLQSNPEYQQFVKFLSEDGGFTRELQNPEWMQRAFNRYMQSRAN